MVPVSGPHHDADVLRCAGIQVLNQEEARFNSADLNIAYRMPVDEYQRLCPYAEYLEENWGKPPGACLCHTVDNSVSAIVSVHGGVACRMRCRIVCWLNCADMLLQPLLQLDCSMAASRHQ